MNIIQKYGGSRRIDGIHCHIHRTIDFCIQYRSCNLVECNLNEILYAATNGQDGSNIYNGIRRLSEFQRSETLGFQVTVQGAHLITEILGVLDQRRYALWVQGNARWSGLSCLLADY